MKLKRLLLWNASFGRTYKGRFMQPAVIDIRFASVFDKIDRNPESRYSKTGKSL